MCRLMFVLTWVFVCLGVRACVRACVHALYMYIPMRGDYLCVFVCACGRVCARGGVRV